MIRSGLSASSHPAGDTLDKNPQHSGTIVMAARCLLFSVRKQFAPTGAIYPVGAIFIFLYEFAVEDGPKKCLFPGKRFGYFD